VNPIAREKKFLRTNLLDGLNKNMMDNLRYFKSVKIFEIGKIFLKNKEKISLAGISSSATMPTGRQAFYEIKGVVESILSGLAITDFWLEDSAEKVADIKIGNDLIGHIDHNGFEIDFEKLAAKAEEELEYMPISRYPAAQRDISLFVPLRTKVVEVLDVIENTAGQLLIDTDLFDIFKKPDEDKKSLAFHLVFQSQEKTLSDKEINSLMDKIMKALDANLEWEVRKK
ncbi:MAG: hypothetical protein ABIJ28_03395, partial [Patescibacteria group bacterium]